MQDGLYRIGEVSRITGISRDTLHFYDKIGLLTPEYVGPENRYRYYSRKTYGNWISSPYAAALTCRWNGSGRSSRCGTTAKSPAS